ncbi:MAG: hypothetical protein IH906_06080, partial [Proteobacteria bacterium]|nr:hypothetical protein [Pseudomonadota bacterium]
MTSKPIEELRPDLLDRVAVSRRSALRMLLLGSSFAVPAIVTFSTARPAAAFTGENFGYSNQTFIVRTLPPGTVELPDGAFFPQTIGSDSGFYIRNTVGGAQFWQFYNEVGGHSWCGPPLCREWNDGTADRQLFANCMFVQPIGGQPQLDAIVDRIVQGPPVSQDFDNAQKLVFAGWPRWVEGGGPVQPECQEYLNSNPAFTTGPSRSGVGTVGSKRRNLFANCAVECDLDSGNRKLGTMGQFYKDFFAGDPNLL